MQYATILVIICFLIKSISFSIYEIKVNKNKLGGGFCIVLAIASFAFALISIILLYGHSSIQNSAIISDIIS